LIANVLSIAGSDPSGGAGIQADLKAFSALGAYGMAALTALTAQNTRGVTGVHPVPPDFVAAQIDAVFADVRVDAVKVGMVGTAGAAAAVADALARNRARAVVVDPVMVAKSGHRLLDDDAVATVRDRLLPLALVATPNLPEAGVLLGREAPADLDGMRAAAADLHRLGPQLVLLKGGHLDGEASPDLLYDGARFVELPAPRVATRNTHGTGCTLSSAIAALLPQRASSDEAVAEAKAYLTAALRAGNRLKVGGGHGPVHHFHALWPAPAEPGLEIAR
jgi:hydroxymethylpyrimidine/phosphomethylpyrimidine kinase